MIKHQIKHYILLCMINKIIYCKSHLRHDENNDNVVDDIEHSKEKFNSDLDDKEVNQNDLSNEKKCWLNFDAKKQFEVLDKLDDRFADVRSNYQRVVGNINFDKEMLQVMVKSRAAAHRALENVGGDLSNIPAGINLGGHCMMRLSDSILFFHRMKLRNNTHFRVTFLHNDLEDMILTTHISLHDINLLGSYERVIIDKDPSMLFYTPTYGQLELLLKRVEYKMEGRYRLLKDRLTIELIVSSIEVADVLMTYKSSEKNEAKNIDKRNIDDFLARLKTDLDNWLKDYFNDYLMYFGLAGPSANAEFLKYDQKKASILNDYVDSVIVKLKKRLRELRASGIKTPKFSIQSVNDLQIKLKDGVIRGFDTMYRRSVATCRKTGDIRNINAVVSFSDLKVEYKYEAQIKAGVPPLMGMLILTADELTAHMEITITKDSESIGLYFEYLQQLKPESLVLEGPANRMISYFKHLLEQHIISMMTNSLIFNIKMLKTMSNCDPFLPGQIITEDGNNEGSAEMEHD